MRMRSSEGIPFTNLRAVEYFVPVGPDRLHYYVTIEDPTVWTRPWTFMLPWEKDRQLQYTDNFGAVTTDPYQIYEYACHEGNVTMESSMRGTMVALQEAAKPSLPVEETTFSLIGQGEADVRARYGEPVAIDGPRWKYSTTDGILQFYAFFEDGKVVRVRPTDLPLDEVVPNR